LKWEEIRHKQPAKNFKPKKKKSKQQLIGKNRIYRLVLPWELFVPSLALQ
jgi:hypothetical protein